MYERILSARLTTGRRSVLLLGPRQVGKSTLLATLDPDLSLNLASPATYRDYLRAPERLEAELRAAPASLKTVFIDEVQRVPALLDVVQVLLDEQPDRFRFLLSGSSARKLRRGNANLLPGRIHVHHLSPLVAAELGADYDVESAMSHGLLPGIWSERDADTRALDLRSYADTYLREEIQAEALVRDLGGFARLLDLVAASSGHVLNLQALCRDAAVGYETARRYVQVLEDTLVVFRVPAWSGSDRASLVAHSKFFLFDTGVRNALLRRPLDRALDDDRGVLLEHLVAHELQSRVGTLWPEMSLFHYRTRHGAEVDYVVQVGDEVWAIEVKASRHFSRSWLSGFASLEARTPLARKIVVFLGARPQHSHDVEVLPLPDFARALPT